MKKILFILFSVSTIISAQTEKLQINNSYIAFTIPEKDLIPENVAYDSITKSFFVGSTRKGKVIKIDKNGHQLDFINQQQDGLWMIIGMKTDVKNRWLWICSSGGDNLIGYNYKDDKQGRPTGIFKYNLDSGQLIKKYTLDKKGEIHFFNDLVIDKKGNAYITHMFNEHSIYTIQKNKDELELFIQPPKLKYPNGITISEDNKFLFVAHSDGLLRIDIASKTDITIKTSTDIKISNKESIDGLYFLNNSLIIVQPDIKTVQQLLLNINNDSVIDNKLLEVNHPMMNNPTTGVLVGNLFYYIANAQFDCFDDDGKLFPLEHLYEPVILMMKLND